MTLLTVLGVVPLLVSLASSEPLACTAAITRAINGCKGEKVECPLLWENYVLATGKNLPFDSGKYAVCKNIETAYDTVGEKVKFFIVNLEFAGMDAQFPPIPGEVAICLPAACDNSDIALLKNTTSQGHSAIANITKHITIAKQPYPNPFNLVDNRIEKGFGFNVALAIVALLIIMVGWSTFMVNGALRRARAAARHPPEVTLLGADADTPAQPLEPRRLPKKLAVCEAFSLVGETGTWTSLWKAEKSRPTDVLNGFRVLSMLFIVCGHGMHEIMGIIAYSNSECIAKTPICLQASVTEPLQWGLLAGQLGVDTFFYIAGFLLSFVGKGRPVPVVMGTALRYARLLPLFGFVQMLYICVSPYLASGPFAPRFQDEVQRLCGNNTWWTELLFINGFFPWYPPENGCMGWSWYLGIDMVFAIIGLMMLNVWKKSKMLGWGLSAFAFVGCSVLTMQQSLHYNMQYNIIDPSFIVYGKELYSRPYGRFPCFIIGMCAPWALDYLEKKYGFERGRESHSTLVTSIVYAACLFALAIMGFCIFYPSTNAASPGPLLGPDGICHHPGGCARPGMQWSYWGSAAWIALSRPLWCSAWLIVTLACYFDYLPWTTAIMAHPIMSPLANLTFGAYLTHPVIIKIIAGNRDGYMNYSAGESIENAVVYAMMAYSAAICCWCLVEKPFATMTGWLVPKKKPRNQAGGVPRSNSIQSTGSIAKSITASSLGGTSMPETHRMETA